MSVKRDFIEAVRLTPDGIQDFLDTPIPEPPTLAMPADENAANVANGVCAWYILELFRPFAGLTPIELLLRIGQHNNVLESAMLAGLEYIEGADPDSNVVTIIEPIEGKEYFPGEMRFSASTANNLCTGMTLTIGEQDPIKMQAVDEIWQQYVYIETSVSATFTATFEDGSESSAIVNFSVLLVGQPPGEIPPEPPQGTDNSAIKRAREHVKTAYGQLIAFIDSNNTVMIGNYKQQFIASVVDFARILQKIPSVTDRAGELIDLTIALPSENTALKQKSSELMAMINTIYAMVNQ